MIMILYPCVLAVSLVGAAEAPASAAAECPLMDNGCRARRYDREAAREDEPERRALLFYSAHVAYLDHYKKTGEASDLCAARRALGKSLAVEGQPEQQRAHFKKARSEVAAIVARDDVQCDRGPKRSSGSAASAESAPPATGDAGATPATSTSASASTSTSTPATTGDREEPLAEPATATVPSQGHANDSLMPTTAIVRRPLLAVPPALLDDDRPSVTARPGRGLVIAGGVTLAAGVVLAGVATYAGVRVADLEDQGFELKKNWDALDMTTRETMDTDLTRRWNTMFPLTLGTAIAGGVGIVVGAALLGEGRHRQIRSATARTAVVPLPGGLALRGRF